MRRSRPGPIEPKKSRVVTFLYQFLGPPTVEGALQGWNPEAREQYKRLRAHQREAARARRAAAESEAPLAR
jgi:hypothetical protein